MSYIKTILASTIAITSLSACKINVNNTDGNASNYGSYYEISNQKISTSLSQLEGLGSNQDFQIIGDANQDNAYIKVWAQGHSKSISKEEVASLLAKNYALDINNGANKLTINAESKIKNLFSLSDKERINIKFEIHVPTSVAAKIQTSSGDIDIERLDAPVIAHSSSGDIEIKNIHGDVSVGTSSGDCNISEIASQKIVAQTSSGDFNATNISTSILTQQSSSGDADLKNINGNLNLHTSSGDLTVKGFNGKIIANTTSGDCELSDADSASVDLHTISGDCTLKVAHPFEQINLSATSGDINAYVPEMVGYSIDWTGHLSYNRLNNFSDGHGATDKNVSGNLNGGGIPFTIKTTSGEAKIHWN